MNPVISGLFLNLAYKKGCGHCNFYYKKTLTVTFYFKYKILDIKSAYAFVLPT